MSGPIIPKIGDKVVAEAFPVSGMPFKLNATKVSIVDHDLTCSSTLSFDQRDETSRHDNPTVQMEHSSNKFIGIGR